MPKILNFTVNYVDDGDQNCGRDHDFDNDDDQYCDQYDDQDHTITIDNKFYNTCTTTCATIDVEFTTSTTTTIIESHTTTCTTMIVMYFVKWQTLSLVGGWH